MRALITGVTGQDGSYLAEQLAGKNWEVHGYMRDGSHCPEIAGMVRHLGDLGDEARLKGVIADVEPGVIFNLGGVSSVAESWRDPENAGRISGLAVSTLLEAAWQLQERSGQAVRFVQASSSEIFGAATLSPQSETTPIAPLNPYGAAKAFAHHLTNVYRSRGLWAANAILFNHESPRRPESFVTRKITMGAARIALGKQDKLLLGNLDAKRDWGWAPDYTDAMVRISGLDEAHDFVLATGEMHSVRDFARLALTAAGINDWTKYVAVDDRFLRPVDAHETRGDSTFLRAQTGWEPSMSFEQVVQSMVEHDLELISRAAHD
ncbi:GDP-mannose 4,6-dehydratase [Pseudarthrobacter sp. MDT1-22]